MLTCWLIQLIIVTLYFNNNNNNNNNPFYETIFNIFWFSRNDFDSLTLLQIVVQIQKSFVNRRYESTCNNLSDKQCSTVNQMGTEILDWLKVADYFPLTRNSVDSPTPTWNKLSIYERMSSLMVPLWEIDWYLTDGWCGSREGGEELYKFVHDYAPARGPSVYPFVWLFGQERQFKKRQPFHVLSKPGYYE